MKTEIEIELKDLKIRRMQVEIKGISPLIIHRFGAKAIKEMEDKKLGKAKNAKHAITNPKKEFEDAKHVSAEGWEGFPVGGIKKCIVRGAKAVGLTMTDVKAGLFIEADCPETNLFRINGESRLRTDHVRVNNGAPDIRYRPEYVNWTATLTVTFNEGLISKDQVLQAIFAGGYGTGIGDWRPERGGDFGRFTIG